MTLHVPPSARAATWGLLLARSTVNPDTGCLHAAGGRSREGYVVVTITKAMRSLGVDSTSQQVHAHRLAMACFVDGPMPTDRVVGHDCHDRAVDRGECNAGACDHRSCINVARGHLELQTQRTNARRGDGGARRTHCPRGHALDAANTYIKPNGTRRCRECNRLFAARARARAA